MADTPTSQRWFGRLSYVVIAFVIIFGHLLPMQTVPARIPAPDFLLAFTFAWAVRRPDFVPVLLIATIFLLADLLFQRPPGLLAALVVLATELLRNRSNAMRGLPFPIEWLTVGLVIVAITFATRGVLAILVTPQVPLTLSLMQTSLTVVIYPIVVLISHLAFGVSRPAQGEVDVFGRPL